jgi:hypothetical protein
MRWIRNEGTFSHSCNCVRKGWMREGRGGQKGDWNRESGGGVQK